MLEPPPWAGGLPLAGETKIMRRYGVEIVPWDSGQMTVNRQRVICQADDKKNGLHWGQ